jgi:hypothetical protein
MKIFHYYTAKFLIKNSLNKLFFSLNILALLLCLNSCDYNTEINNNYETEEKIEEVIGVDLPEFTVESSQITHAQAFDAEFTTNVVLKFKILPDKQFFLKLDSICALKIPDTIEENNKTFVAGLESYYNPWSKDSNQYRFEMIGDHLKRRLHKEDAFFMLSIKKNSAYAEIRYGNF